MSTSLGWCSLSTRGKGKATGAVELITHTLNDRGQRGPPERTGDSLCSVFYELATTSEAAIQSGQVQVKVRSGTLQIF